MRTYKLDHVGDDKLLRDLATLVARDRATTAELLAHIAEVDARRLFVPLGFPSMVAYCTDALHLSEGATYKRIQAARAARKCPALFGAVADGRLHLTAVVFLAPYLTTDNADELIAAATHKTKSEVEALLAQRFPKPDVPTRVRAVGPRKTKFDQAQLVPEPVVMRSQQVPEPAPDSAGALASAPMPTPAPAPATQSKVKPIAPKRFAIQATIDQSTHDKLRHAQALLSHKMPSGDLAHVLDCALDALVEKLEKRKFAATCTPRASSRRVMSNRTIPARVRRAVWARDRGQCTFVGKNGHRCSASKFLEYDHVDPVARGGEATIRGIRLRCRTHNQYEAEQIFGVGFMQGKRESARRARVRAAGTV